MRIAVYAIALNEERHVDRFLASVREADMVVVADTGSTDGTVAALEAGGAVVHQIRIQPWRFDDARNAALALVPPNIDICVSLDLDEVLSPGWRALVEAAWTPEITHIEYRYVTSHLRDGRPAIEMRGGHIHRRHGYRWRNLIHEMLMPDRIKPKFVYIPEIVRDHYPDSSKSRAQYLPMLEAACVEDPRDPRHAYLLGREYVMLRRWDEGEAELLRYLELSPGKDMARRMAAMRRLAICRAGSGALDEAVVWLERALGERIERATLAELAEVHRQRKDWAKSHDAVCRAIAMPRDPPGHINEWRARPASLSELAAIAAEGLGRRDEALRYAERAEAEEPWVERFSIRAKRLRDLGPVAATVPRGVADGADEPIVL